MQSLREALINRPEKIDVGVHRIPEIKEYINKNTLCSGLRVTNKGAEFFLTAQSLIVKDDVVLREIKKMATWKRISFLEIDDVKESSSLEEMGMPLECDYLVIQSKSGVWKSMVGIPKINTKCTIIGYGGKTIDAYIDCPDISFQLCGLKSLDNLPKEVENLTLNQMFYLKDLETCPEHVKYNFNITNCDIKSLKGAPKTVGRTFSVRGCDNLKSKEYEPKAGYIDYKYNRKLK